jgi:hypothetical protein
MATNIISTGLVAKYRRELLNFCQLSDTDIFNIWCKEGDVIDDLNSLVYMHNSPTYQKMVFKFRSLDNQPVNFYASCGNGNKHMLLKWFGMHKQEAHQLMDYFVWLSTHCSPQTKFTRKDNVIKYFIDMPPFEQQNFINMYQC